LALALGACEGAGWPEAPAEHPAPETAATVDGPETETEIADAGASTLRSGRAAAAEDGPGARKADTPETAPEGAGGEETAALPPEPVIDDDPRRLMGLDRAGLSAILGDPQLVRREAPAEIWQYRSETCVFDVFLYDQAGAQRVTYLEARDRDAAKIETRPCLNELLRARPGKPLG
jgi:hypothetical protein